MKKTQQRSTATSRDWRRYNFAVSTAQEATMRALAQRIGANSVSDMIRRVIADRAASEGLPWDDDIRAIKRGVE